MRNTYLTLIYAFAFCVFPDVVISQPNSWESTNSPGYLTISKIVSTNGICFATGYLTGILQSSNDGETWTRIIVGIVDQSDVRSLAISSGGTLAAGTLSGKLLLSINGGATWSLTDSVPTNHYITEVAFKDEKAVLIGTNSGLFLSSTDGENLTLLGLEGQFISRIVIKSARHLFVITQIVSGVMEPGTSAIFRSTDGGQNWAKIDSTRGYVSQIAVLPDGRLLMSSSSGVFKSMDNGDTWVRTQLTKRATVMFVEASSGHVYVEYNDPMAMASEQQFSEIARSRDSGNSWETLDWRKYYQYARTIFVTHAGTILVGTDGGIFRSTDGGMTFIGTRHILSIGYDKLVRSLAINSSGHIYAALNGIYYSTDRGESWRCLGFAWSGSGVTGPASVSVNKNGTILVGSLTGDLYRWQEEKSGWKFLFYPPPVEPVIPVATPSGDFYVWNRSGYVYRVRDDGSIASSSRIPSRTARAFAIDSSDNVLVVDAANNLLRSTDKGITWSSISTLPSMKFIYTITANKDGYIFVGGWGTVYPYTHMLRSIDGGNSWTPIDLPSVPDWARFWSYVVALTVNSDGSLFASEAYLRRVYRSDDMGSTWTDNWTQNNFLGKPSHECLAVDQRGTLYIGTDLGVFRTSGRTTSVESTIVDQPRHFQLHQNYPNPFNPTTTFSFALPSRSFVTLKVFDPLGRKVSILLSEELPAGTYSQQWNATGFPSGVYFYRLQAGSFSETKKLILLR